MILLDVAAKFNKEVRLLHSNNKELCNFILNHERKNLCLKNLCKQITDAERQMGFKFTKNHMETLIIGTVKFFSDVAKNQRDTMMMSQIKTTTKDENEKMNNLENNLIEEGIILGNKTT